MVETVLPRSSAGQDWCGRYTYIERHRPFETDAFEESTQGQQLGVKAVDGTEEHGDIGHQLGLQHSVMPDLNRLKSVLGRGRQGGLKGNYQREGGAGSPRGGKERACRAGLADAINRRQSP